MPEENTGSPCPRCGQPRPPSQANCPACGYRSNGGSVPAGRILGFSFIALALLFVVTGFAARLYHAKQRALAEQWFARGDADLQEGRAGSALEDYRNALSYSPENALYELRLAQALMASNRLAEANAYLVSLRERSPGSGQVNLELAHLSVGMGDVQDASRYYHSAIYGVWEEDPQQRRLETRLELCQFLLGRGATNSAQAELAGLAANVPPDNAPLHAQVGNLFLQAQEPDRALREFQLALKQDHRQPAALLGAGEAAFQMGDFRQAERYLTQAVRGNKANARAIDLLDTTKLVLAHDPFELGLSDEERARRVARDFDQALGNLRNCAAKLGQTLRVPEPQSELQKTYAKADGIRRQVHSPLLWRHPDRMMQAMDQVLEMEQVAERTCGPLTGVDQALLLIGEKRKPFER